ncbi:MAG: glycoside hydrolase family 30 beta sandwich domain-containing protein [Cyclobacteriaceae bacterium]
MKFFVPNWSSWIERICIVVLFPLASASTSSTEQSSLNSSLANAPQIKVWLTNPDKSSLFAQTANINFNNQSSSLSTITIDTATQYQTMDGFGYTLTGGSAQLMIQKLNSTTRSSLLKELFTTENNGIGISYLRISIGSSDLDDHVFSYDDLPSGQTDVGLKQFNLGPDNSYLIPVLKEIVKLNPAIKILGSPWSPPPWMKTNKNAKGGHLDTAYYQAYANYFVKYIQAMAQQGIIIDAVTLQNEPENPDNTPSLLMTAEEQKLFIKKYVGPAFRASGIKTKIILFDHNCDHPNYALSVLSDNAASQFIDGSAFHLYLGDISALSTVRNAYPMKSVYFTEQWTSGNGNFAGDLRWHLQNLIVGAPRNWSKNVLEWNLVADEGFNPHTIGGCTLCQGALTINSASGGVTRNVSYYIIAHASKFVRPGSVRISSNIIDDLYNVAYKTPDGKKVLIVINTSDVSKTFSINYKSMNASASLQAGAAGTYVW